MSQHKPFTWQQPMRKALALDKFPELRSALHPLESELTSKLFAFGSAAYRDDLCDREWTGGIKDALERLGQEKGCLPFPNSLKERWNRGGEWLFDHVWCNVGDVDGTEGMDWREAKSLKLAVESEWSVGEHDLLSDFMKLTFVVAEYRLFIYTNSPIRLSDNKRAEPADECFRRSQNDHNYRYLLLGFPNEWDGEFRVDAWTS